MKRSGQPETHGKFDHVQFNSNAVGMAVARLYGSKIDFTRNPISGSAARFFVILLEFSFTLLYEIKIFERNFFHTKIISFSKADFQKSTNTSNHSVGVKEYEFRI